MGADEIVVDLEDAVPAAEKTEKTRQRAARALTARAWPATAVAVRVNAVDTLWFEEDMRTLVGMAGDVLDSVVLPKVEAASDLAAAEAILDELGSRVGLQAQIESARGLVQVEAIAASSRRLEALVFGPADYAGSLGIPQLEIGGSDNRYPGDQWHYARSRIAVAAHAHNLDAIDGPYGVLQDIDGLRVSACRARLLGFGGKWAIHPAQLATCNEAFTPSSGELDWAVRVLDALNAAELAGRGPALLDGSMIDTASRRLAERMLTRAGCHPQRS